MDQMRTLATRKVLEYFLTLSKVMAQDNLGCEEKHFFAAKEEAVARQREKWKYISEFKGHQIEMAYTHIYA